MCGRNGRDDVSHDRSFTAICQYLSDLRVFVSAHQPVFNLKEGGREGGRESRFLASTIDY